MIRGAPHFALGLEDRQFCSEQSGEDISQPLLRYTDWNCKKARQRTQGCIAYRLQI